MKKGDFEHRYATKATIYASVMPVSSNLNNMKRVILILITSALALTGCMKGSSNLEKADFAIDAAAHSITFTLDFPVETFWVNENGTDNAYEGSLDEEGKTLTCDGGWYTSSVKLESPKEIILNVDENTTGEDRQLIISAYHMGKSGCTVITQTAK